MLFSKEDLQEKMVEDVHPFLVREQTDEPSGHREQRMTVWVFWDDNTLKLYKFELPYDEMQGRHWFDVPEQVDCPEVTEHQVITTEYRIKKS